MDGRTAEVDTLPGKKQVRRFFGDRQREQLGEIVRTIIRQPVNVRLAAIETPKPHVDESAMGEGNHAGSQGLSPDRQARKEAMDSPAVKQIIDLFDARLIKTYTVRPEESDDSGTPENPSAPDNPRSPDA